MRLITTSLPSRRTHGMQRRNIIRDFQSPRLVERRALSQHSSTDSVGFDNYTRSHVVRVMEIPVSNLKDEKKTGVLHMFVKEGASTGTSWTSHNCTISNDHKEFSTTEKNYRFNVHEISKEAICLLLPAQYPQSVAPGYLGFASFCFVGSIAGSAAMVLSTQTLLLAVGIVGQNVQHSSIMAGAFNWVMKDFVGQLGGVFFASQMGKTRSFDSNPKRWRMVAAMALDSATFLEILSPLFPAYLVLPVASVANIGKNIGFLTASASRAALHQSIAISGNLGDVTAKSGSQSIMASLIGTSLGIGLSSLLQHDTYNFALGFLGLTIVHQGCTYMSLQYVPLANFNRQRLLLVLEAYLASSENSSNRVVLSPSQVARMERFFPLDPSVESTAKDWLRIGASIQQACPHPTQLEKLLALTPGESYLICFRDEDFHDDRGKKIDLVYLEDGTGEDIIRGMYHACLLRADLLSSSISNILPATHDGVRRTHDQVQQDFPHLLEQLHNQGWKTDSDVTMVESSTAYRLCIQR